MNTVTVNENLVSLEWGAFEDCTSLESLTLNDTFKTIGSYAFYGSGIKQITFGNGLETIGSNAFYNCNNLESLELGEGITSIGYAAFYNCTGLKGDLVIPSSVTSIGVSAFYGCTGLNKKIVIEGNEESTSIGAWAFYNCKNVKSIELGEGVTSIGDGAFSGCTGLVGDLVSLGVEKGDLPAIYKIGLAMIISAAVGLFGGIMGAVFGSKASAGLAKNLRKSMFENIQTFSFENIDKFSTAGLVTRLTTDVTNIQNAFIMILRMGFRAPVTVISAMILSFTISPKIAYIFLVAMILLLIVMVFVMTKARPLFDTLFKKYDALNASVQENITGMRVVKA